jgi:uncharacterized protein
MQLDRLISGDNHIDLTYCPPELWSAQAPGKWKLLAPRTELLDDGLHWFVEAQDKGMWKGCGTASGLASCPTPRAASATSTR